MRGTRVATFFYVLPGFPALGRLVADLQRESDDSLWFSHGLACLVSFSRTDELQKRIARIVAPELRGLETWHLKHGVLQSTSSIPPTPPALNEEEYAVAIRAGFPAELAIQCEELSHTLSFSVTRANQYAPKLLPSFQKLAATINSLIEIIEFCLHPSGAPPQSISSTFADHVATNAVFRQQQLHLRTEEFAQINAALAYLNTQAFSGVIPILNNPCPIRQYSLLGVGTPYLALAAFAQHVEKAFAKFPVDEAVRTRLATTTGAPPHKHLGEDRSDWSELTACRIDHNLPAPAPSRLNPKLVYYSGRQGFRETRFAITAPISMIPLGMTSRWSPMTLSHEFMHAHVTAILAAISADDNGRPVEIAFEDQHAEYRRYIEGRGQLQPLRPCLRHMVFNFCLWSQAVLERIQDTDNLAVVEQGPSTAAALHRAMENHAKDLNEFLVHTLDFTYFYETDARLYLRLLWESWTPVPMVLADISFYLLRSLIAVASAETGREQDRFHRAAELTMECLEDILQRDPTNVVVTSARDVLREQQARRVLYLRFLPGLYIADAAIHFLTSRHICAELLKDERRDAADVGGQTQGTYHISIGHFDTSTVESPVAFWMQMLRQSLDSGANAVTDDAVAAWSYLAAASPLGR